MESLLLMEERTLHHYLEPWRPRKTGHVSRRATKLIRSVTRRCFRYMFTIENCIRVDYCIVTATTN